jgi:UDP-GlcNAc:undecaprenyl-phosphate/decaprenyl-phosphate GlcNAc-1-phosphate transferase
MAASYAVIFAVSLVVSLLLTPFFIRLAFRVGAVDQPGPRRVNLKPAARMGGPAMFVAFAAAIFVFGRHISSWSPVLAGSFIVLLVGLVDDVRPQRAMLKLAGQVVAASVAYALGVRIEFVTNPTGVGVAPLSVWVSYILTVGWLVGVTNAVNLIDGLDGLAAGIVSIASLTFFLVAVSRGQVESAMLAMALAGATGGFLRWNFYPAKTFMGDSGAYFLGFTAGALAIQGAFKSTTALTLLIPIFALGVPIFDTGFAIVRRLRSHQSVMSAPDKGHIHHRFLAAGWHQRDAVITCYLITFGLSALSLALVKEWILALYLLLSVAALTLLLIGAGKIIKRKRMRV